MLTLQDLGEFPLIKKISKQFSLLVQSENTGIGDDCAIIPINDENAKNRANLVTTDLFIEGTHFLKNKMSAQDVGYKALAVNISDIAAMGGRAESAFLSLGLPAALEINWVDDFFQGFYELAASEKIQLLGGDTTKSQLGIVINITLLGTCKNSQVKKRSTAMPNDLVCVTGFLGDSRAGLDIILKNLPSDSVLLKKHSKPRPHSQEGIWLGEQKSTHALIDISDGLDSDLKRLMEASNCGFEINLNSLPISKELHDFCVKNGLDSQSYAALGGEDYCLLATIDELEFNVLQASFLATFQRELYVIGRVTDRKNGLIYLKNETTFFLEGKSYEHFTK